MKRNRRKLMFVILLNIFLVALGLYVLDMLNIFTMGEVFRAVGFQGDRQPKIEDPNLLEKEELKKQWLVLKLRENELTKSTNQLKEVIQKIQDKRARLEQAEKELKAREQQLVKNEQDKVARERQIQKVASDLMNMEPQRAVERLEQMPDDLLVIEILKAIDTLSEDMGRKSIVPYLLSLMKKERVAVLQRKMVNMSPNQRDEF